MAGAIAEKHLDCSGCALAQDHLSHLWQRLPLLSVLF